MESIILSFFVNYGLFLAKTVTIVLAVLVIAAGLVAIISKGKSKPKERVEIKKLNDKYDDMRDNLNKELLDKQRYKALLKAEKKASKAEKTKKDASNAKLRKRLFVLNFHGD